MKIVKLNINNFRGIKTAELYFENQTLLVGRNNVGKSTICEALDLVLGPDRLSRPYPINEYDFYNGKYLTGDGEKIQITIEIVLTELSEKALNTFSRNLEFWNVQETKLLAMGEIDDTNKDHVAPCLRLLFKGEYDQEEDEFIAKTYYAHSPDEEDEEVLTEVYKKAKREIGFIYLRTLRTGSRALSLERGSLLDVLLRIGQVRPQLWEDTRRKLMELDPPLDDSMGELRPILNNIEARIKQYIPLDVNERPTRLFVSQLTREHLRKTLSFFMSTSQDQSPVPFQDLGTGTLNTLVFALLSAIAELKEENIIFAMEEPEIAVPPHTQRRIVNYLLENTSQSFVTSHSPYVIEKFSPEQIKILRRDNEGNITSTPVNLSSGLKPKLFQRKLRHSISEAILGQGVIVGEGLVEYQALLASAEKLEASDDNNFPLDLSGVTLFDSGGDGNLASYGAFFKSLGLKTFAFYDKKNRTPDEIAAIEMCYDKHKQTDYSGIEKLITNEISTEVEWLYLLSLSESGVLNNGPHFSNTRPSDDEVRKLTLQVLVDSKGDGRVAELIKHCSVDQIPISIKSFLKDVYSVFPKPEDVEPIAMRVVGVTGEKNSDYEPNE